MFRANGYKMTKTDAIGVPWSYRGDGIERERWFYRGPQTQGEALLYHKQGWTAISFWDRSVDERGS